MNDITPEQIAQHYSAAMDSVNFINELVAGEHDDRMTAEEKADASSAMWRTLRSCLPKTSGRLKTCNPSTMRLPLAHESLNRHPRT
jgi:hypothetical protein